MGLQELPNLLFSLYPNRGPLVRYKDNDYSTWSRYTPSGNNPILGVARENIETVSHGYQTITPDVKLIANFTHCLYCRRTGR